MLKGDTDHVMVVSRRFEFYRFSVHEVGGIGSKQAGAPDTA